MAETPDQKSWTVRVLAVARRFDTLAYAVFAGASVLWVARWFYGSLKLQLFYSAARKDPDLPVNDWSAPLDDVFIHFDFARSAARGAPFEWSMGNGYSSGGTSLLYPLVLSPGYWLGFRGERLMHFAAIVACTSVLAFLLASRRLFRPLPSWTAYLAPPFLLSVGALDWSFYSGMEVAFFLAIWGLTFVLWDDLVHPERDGEEPRFGALGLGLANGILAATRPEAAVLVLVFSLTAARAVARRRGVAAGAHALVLGGVFAGLVVVGQTVANRLLTGDWSAAGALVKLEIYDPRLTAREALDAWLFHVRYQVARVTGHHVAGHLAVGSLLWVLAAVPLAWKSTRSYAVLLWAHAVLWVLVVALNGQVRWQNERYTMPALAWLLLSAALGVGVLCTHDWGRSDRRPWVRWAAASAAVITALSLAWVQGPRMRDQIWFFGRASRNIRDQHVKVARRIRRELPSTNRILVGDAGAIPYAADLPALDIIGLGGYPGLPFARASRWGVAAALELVERIPPAERPDILAIYPGWWGDFPLWFGTPIDGVSVRGNVICGGLTKMIYEARWVALDRRGAPSVLREGERVRDVLDLGDVISEAAHDYRIRGAPGHVAMKLLAHPARPSAELWDAGRVVPPGAAISFSLSGFVPSRAARLLLRVAPPQSASLDVEVAPGGAHFALALRPKDGWAELTIELPADRVADSLDVTIRAVRSEVVIYHLWGIQSE